MAKKWWQSNAEQDEQEKARQESWNQMQQALGMVAGQVKQLTAQVNTLAKQKAGPVAAAPTVQLQPHEPKMDMTGLPDPVTDKDKFLTEVQKRLQAQMDTVVATMKAGKEQEQRSSQAAAAANAKVDALWKKWQKDHPEFAKMGKIVKAEAQEMVQEGAAQGMSAEDVLFGDEEGFLGTLAERVGAAAKDMGLEPVPAKSGAEAAAEVDEGLKQFEGQFRFDRQSGGAGDDLAAGDAGALAPRKGAKGDEKPMPLVDQLRKAQEAMGIA